MKMQEKKLRRFRAYQVIANVLFYIIVILGGIGLLIALTGEVVLASNNVDIAGFADQFITKFVPEVEIPIMLPNGFFHTLIIGAITGASIALAMSGYLFKSVSNLFGNIVKTETPFHQKSIRILRSIGIAFFIYTAAEFVVSMVLNISLSSFFQSGGFKFDTSIQFSTIIYGLLILALAEIFEFGAGLQKDSESIV